MITYASLSYKLCEGILFASDGAQVALLFNAAAIVKKVDSHVSICVRAAVDLDAADKSSVWFVHDDVSWLDLFEEKFIFVTIVGMNEEQILHVVKFIKLIHIIEWICGNLALLKRFILGWLQVCK